VIPSGDVEAKYGSVLVGPLLEFEPRVFGRDVEEVADEWFSCSLFSACSRGEYTWVCSSTKELVFSKEYLTSACSPQPKGFVRLCYTL
jgi:hypothetical protein